jgi:DNA-directed RNA polymerase I subunit RPA43
VGRINLCSPDHISILLHRTFNVSIPRHHIPTEKWEFEHGPAENDPEFGSGAQDDACEQDRGKGISGKGEEYNSGKWVHRLTHETLGGEAGILEFTVIGYFFFQFCDTWLATFTRLDRLTVANEMLSLLGSLQKEPFCTA